MDFTTPSPPLVSTLETRTTAATSTTVVEGSSWRQNLQDILFGSLGGMAGKLFEYPFDTIKVRLQTQSLAHPVYAGPWDCFQQTLMKEGPHGFYKGLSSPLMGAMLENAALFLGYNEAQKHLRAFSGRQQLGIAELSLAGAISGAFASVILTPIELIKCKLQVQTADPSTSRIRFKGPFHVISHTLRTHGLSGFYRGHLATFLRETGGGAAWFGVYEYICAQMLRHSPFSSSSSTTPRTKDDLKALELMTAGALAGMAYNFTLFPADVVKSRMQTDEELGPGTAGRIKRSFREVAREVWRGEGIKGFYRGCGITVLRSGPSSAIIFMTYETLTRYFGSRLSEGLVI